MKTDNIPNEILADLRLHLGVDDDDRTKDHIIQCYDQRTILTNWMTKNGLDTSHVEPLLKIKTFDEFGKYCDINGLFGYDLEIWLILDRCKGF